jgi:hypothetical protein
MVLTVAVVIEVERDRYVSERINSKLRTMSDCLRCALSILAEGIIYRHENSSRQKAEHGHYRDVTLQVQKITDFPACRILVCSSSFVFQYLR